MAIIFRWEEFISPKKKLKKYRSGCFETVSCRTQNNENHGIF